MISSGISMLFQWNSCYKIEFKMNFESDIGFADWMDDIINKFRTIANNTLEMWDRAQNSSGNQFATNTLQILSTGILIKITSENWST